MSQDFYHLHSDPFRSIPDPACYFPSVCCSTALTAMRNALQQGESFVTVTGLPGTGKTTLIEQFQSELDCESVCIAKLNSTRMRVEDLLRTICLSLAVDVDGQDKGGMLYRLRKFLLRWAEMGRCTLLLVDEAQDLSPQALEELRLLGNLQRNGQPVLQIILVGQEPLLETLQLSELKPLFQRLGAACHLMPLRLQEVRAYIEHRLHCAGWEGNPVFTEHAYRMIHCFSEGFPREINRLCSRLLRRGYAEKKHTLYSFDALIVLRDLLEELPGSSREQSFAACVDILNESRRASGDSQDVTRVEADARARFLEAEREWVRAWTAKNRTGDDRQGPLASLQGSKDSPDSAEGVANPVCASPPPVSAPSGKQVSDLEDANAVSERSEGIPMTAGANNIASEIQCQSANRIEQPVVHNETSSMASHALSLRSALTWGARLLQKQRTRLVSVVRNSGGSRQALKSFVPSPDYAAFLFSAGGAVAATLLVLLLFVGGNNEETQESLPPVGEKPPAPEQVLAEQSVALPSTKGNPDAAVVFDDTLVWDKAIQYGDTLSTGSDDQLSTPRATHDLTQESDDMEAALSGTAFTAPQSERLSITELDEAVEDTEHGASPEQRSESDVVAATQSIPAAPAPEPALSDEQAFVAEPIAPADPVPSEYVTKQKQVSKLMALAEQAIEDNRLTVPVDNNALHYYRQVIELAPDHGEAQAGMHRIAQRYVKLVGPMLETKQLDRAKTFVARGLMVAPHNQELLALRNRIAALEASLAAQAEMATMEAERPSPPMEEPAQEEAPRRFWDKFKRFFQNPEPAEAP